MKAGNRQTFDHEKARCRQTSANGKRCEGWAMDGSDFCFFHNPESKDARHAAQSRGGQGNRGPVLSLDSEDVQLRSAQDLAELLAETITQVRKGLISPKIATAIGYLAGPLMRAFDAGSMETRLARLEQALNSRPAAGLFDPDAPIDAENK